MAHTYHMLNHWHQWLSQQDLGKSLLEVEIKEIGRMIGNHLGKHALILGVPSQLDYLKNCPMTFHSLITPLHTKENNKGLIESHFQELPLQSGSIDLVILPHTHEFIDNPRQLIIEACRIVKPEGMIIMTGFNPYSLWGLEHLIYAKRKVMPWRGNVIMAQQIKNWLKLYDYNIESHRSIFFRPFIKKTRFFKQLAFLEKFGKYCLPNLGGVYIIAARAKVIPLTPIKLKWRQEINNIRISTSFPGFIARQ